MIIKLKNNDLIDKIVLWGLLLNIMAFRWLELSDTVNNILVITITLIFIFKSRYYLDLNIIVPISLLIIYPAFNYLIWGGKIWYLFRNTYRTFKGILFFIYVSTLISLKPEMMFKFIKKLFIPLNIFELLNVFILILQLNGQYSLASLHVGSLNQYYIPDLISGLFGLYGTPCLAMYSVLIFLYNFCYEKYIIQNKRYRKFINGYNFALLLFNFWISTQNDNKGFYLIFIIYMIDFYIISHNSSIYVKQRRFNKKLFIIIFNFILLFSILSIVLAVSYQYFESFRDSIDMLVRKFYEGLVYTNVYGGGERIGMILFTLLSPGHRLFGFGLGKYLYVSGNLGFAHFGQADMGTFLCLGGISLILLLFFPLYLSFKKNKMGTINTIFLLLTYIFLAVYTQIFTNTSTAIIGILIYCVFWVTKLCS